MAIQKKLDEARKKSDEIFEALDQLELTRLAQYERDSSTKILWYCKVTNRWCFKNILLHIHNKPAVVAADKLKTIEATLMNLQLSMDHFYKGFVKDMHLFTSIE